MSYRRKQNSHSIWQNHCQRNRLIIEEIGLEAVIFSSEQNFREYLTKDTLANKQDTTAMNQISDAAFNLLIKFVDGFPFDMDGILFDAYNAERSRRFYPSHMTTD